MRVLTFSSLYPSEARPRHGIFVEARLRQLVDSGEVSSRVVCPVPWFPFTAGPFGEYRTYARVARREQRHGLEVVYPRFPVIPKIGMSAAPWLMSTAMQPELRRIEQQGFAFDLIDAHYFYPDGVAAVALGRALGKPVVITARGSDINLIPRYPGPRRMIQAAARDCAAIITVSQALKESLRTLGVDGSRISVLRNGVDLARFRPLPRAELRAELGVKGATALSVGNLVEGKGHHLAIEALHQLPGVNLIVVGEGPERARLEQAARALDDPARVRFTGNVPQDTLSRYYGAADVLVLASAREGMPNVVLEAMACGTPVVATAVGGIPEVVTAPEAGVLMTERSVAACAHAMATLLAADVSRDATRAYATRFGWEDATKGQLKLFRQVLASRRSGA